MALGCSGRVAAEPSDAAPTSETGPGGSPAAGGCPTIVPPTGGEACTGGVYYCHYFKSETDCVTSIKCTFKGSSHIWVGGSGSDCTFPASACDEGKPCERVFEPEGACIVAGVRVCQCSMGSTLRCTSL